MSIDQICVAGAGVSFVGIGINLRKQQNKQWRAYFFGGLIMLLLVIVASIFGLSM